MKLALLAVLTILMISGPLAAQSDDTSADFNLGYSLDWTPFHYSTSRVSMSNANTEMYLVTMIYSETNRKSESHRLVDFTAGPFTLSEINQFNDLRRNEEDIQVLYNKLHGLIELRPLFLVETKTTKSEGIISINIFKNDSRFFEVWRLWKPRWIFLADLKKMNHKKQQELFLDEFKIRESIEY